METKTPAAAVTPITPSQETAPLAVIQPPGTLSTITEVVWTKERVDLIRRMKCPPDTTEDEFAIFLMQCKRTGMDPLIDEADCVPRWKTVKVRGQNGMWFDQKVEAKVFQPREAGMRARADRFPDYKGIAFGVVREGDVFDFSPSEKKVTHSFNPADPKRQLKPIMGAWAQISRTDRVCAPVWVPLSERIQLKTDGKVTQMWNTKTETMIGKCARADAYKMEYPNVFAGNYIVEEWEQEEREINEAPEPHAGAAPAAPQTKTSAVLQQVKDRLADLKKPEEWQIVQPPAPDKTPAPPASPPKTGKAAKPKRAPGTFRDAPIETLSAEAMGAALLETEAWLREHPMSHDAPQARALLDDLQQEQARRIASSVADIDAPPPTDEDAPF